MHRNDEGFPASTNVFPPLAGLRSRNMIGADLDPCETYGKTTFSMHSQPRDSQVRDGRLLDDRKNHAYTLQVYAWLKAIPTDLICVQIRKTADSRHPYSIVQRFDGADTPVGVHYVLKDLSCENCWHEGSTSAALRGGSVVSEVYKSTFMDWSTYKHYVLRVD